MKSFLMLAAIALVSIVLGGNAFAGETGEVGKSVKGQAPVASAVKGQAPAPVAHKGQAPEVKGQAPKGKIVANKTVVTETIEISDVQVVAVSRKRLFKGKFLAPASTCTSCASGTCCN